MILQNITFHLCDINKEVVDAWELYFEGYDNFKFYCGNIFDVPINEENNNALVSPANSFGDLQGGIDLAYYHYFGPNLETMLQNVIIKEKYGELIVGDTIMLKLNNVYGYFISAPTMRVPQKLETNSVNAFLAFRAVLIKLIEFNKDNDDPITHVLCPGLGTSIGKLAPNHCAKQMLDAYNIMIKPDDYLELARKSCEHYSMTTYYAN